MLYLLLLLPLVAASKYVVQPPPLTTDWTYAVGSDPWTENPRPQMTRDRWRSLNGIWSYKNASGLDDVYSPPSGDLGQGVMIPSCLESGLSGIQAQPGTVSYSWFQTTFDVPSDWTGDNVIINFGAVDYEATVFVNGHNATFHRGGYTRFWADITQWIHVGSSNELAVFVHDPTDSGNNSIPVGKQTLFPSHIFYRPCSGIWQGVFIEPVPSSYVSTLDVSADMNGEVNITVHSSDKSHTAVKIHVLDKSGNSIGSGSGNSDEAVTFSVTNPSLWSPDSPTLYNISVKMGEDQVGTYTGFRTIEKGDVYGVTRPLLNGEFIFAFGTLDQGYWPDGIYTPPSYGAMIYDLQVLKDLGFNMVRKHIKVETDLFYRACDEMGLLVMQDMPSLPPQQSFSPNVAQQAEFERQLFEIIDTHKSFPSIYTWVIYNEGWQQLPSGPEAYLTPQVQSLDPTRLVNSVSGWHDHGAGDYLDNHHYSDPQCGTRFTSIYSSPYDPDRIGFQGEFGGVGHNVSIDHLWNVEEAISTINQTYELDDTIEIWNYRSHILLSTLKDQTTRFACSGGVWTQTTDVEGEVNGLLTYDRRLLRCDVVQWKSDIQALYDAASARANGHVGGRKSGLLELQIEAWKMMSKGSFYFRNGWEWVLGQGVLFRGVAP
ncbi:family 2 glycoside hydrolase [Naematelia encephala]|uniref:Family 2 glycoside hydrolase n=1 Tax=Naematelia encephala TaxID=71784 RepID=A0A1Y2BBW2_9TREE|nr:family 2 glycoside hydrolase [Naematelia encephala]